MTYLQFLEMGRAGVANFASFHERGLLVSVSSLGPFANCSACLYWFLGGYRLWWDCISQKCCTYGYAEAYKNKRRKKGSMRRVAYLNVDSYLNAAFLCVALVVGCSSFQLCNLRRLLLCIDLLLLAGFRALLDWLAILLDLCCLGWLAAWNLRHEY